LNGDPKQFVSKKCPSLSFFLYEMKDPKNLFFFFFFFFFFPLII